MRARPVSDGDEEVHDVADAALPAVRLSFVEALALAVQQATDAAILTALATGSAAVVVAAVRWQAFQNALVAAWTPTIRDVVRESWTRHAPTLPPAARIGFGLRNPQAEAWALRHTAEMIQRLSLESAEAVRAIVVDALAKGLNPTDAAKRIRSVIGLNGPQAKAYLRRADELQANVLAGSMTEGTARQRLLAYRRSQIVARADLIARTETMKAANAGKQLLWEAAYANGHLGHDPKRMWVTTPDEKTCPVCEPIPGHGPVGLKEPFVGGNGLLYDQPPAHPQCRCTMVLVL